MWPLPIMLFVGHGLSEDVGTGKKRMLIRIKAYCIFLNFSLPAFALRVTIAVRARSTKANFILAILLEAIEGAGAGVPKGK